jgi:hypothetical protein
LYRRKITGKSFFLIVAEGGSWNTGTLKEYEEWKSFATLLWDESEEDVLIQ